MKQCYSASFMVKFLKQRDHAESFLAGNMQARRLAHFKALENDSARGDPDDGLRTYQHVLSQPAPSSEHFTHVADISVGEHGVLAIGFDYTTDEDPYVICLSRFRSDAEDASCLEQLQRQINAAPKMGAKFGPHAVIIEDQCAFLHMVDRAAKDRRYALRSELVAYRPEGKESNFAKPMDAFCKSARFAPQHEFRIVLTGGDDAGETLHLPIGDLDGIARMVRTADLKRARLIPRGD